MARNKKRNGNTNMAKLRCRLELLIADYNVNRQGDEKLTQKRLAEKTNLSENTISRLMRNDFAQIEADTIEKLCDFFGIDYDLNKLLMLVREKKANGNGGK